MRSLHINVLSSTPEGLQPPSHDLVKQPSECFKNWESLLEITREKLPSASVTQDISSSLPQFLPLEDASHVAEPNTQWMHGGAVDVARFMLKLGVLSYPPHKHAQECSMAELE